MIRLQDSSSALLPAPLIGAPFSAQVVAPHAVALVDGLVPRQGQHRGDPLPVVAALLALAGACAELALQVGAQQALGGAWLDDHGRLLLQQVVHFPQVPFDGGEKSLCLPVF
eukprot:CAMPEP_0194585254 /NCGR_PEP_ID=MMETSP0292-20121207/17642_1 /TAXON_ID=39354 /ORGANISM="Heterosigma akashiwo, Strain CCMP2393" /LENGTH=111 /DNA_ID=CAMNT_0039440665 /DNA_START=147 /DNA_END=483 /DNA_ORIENTATION=+